MKIVIIYEVIIFYMYEVKKALLSYSMKNEAEINFYFSMAKLSVQ